MSFTDGKPRIATETECGYRWGGEKPGVRFRCYLCGHKFRPGDPWRWVYTNSSDAPGNPLVCGPCDGPDVLERWRKHYQRAMAQFWWMA